MNPRGWNGKELELVHQHLKVHYPLKDCPPWTSHPSITELRQTTTSWASKNRYSLHYYTIQPDSACVAPAWCLGWMPIAASHVSVKWHPSIAEQVWSYQDGSKKAEPALHLIFADTFTGYGRDECRRSCRRRRADGNTWRTCASGRWFRVGLFLHELLSVSMRTWLRGILLFFMWDPMSFQHLFSHKRVKQELSYKPLLPISKSGSLIELYEYTPGCWG